MHDGADDSTEAINASSSSVSHMGIRERLIDFWRDVKFFLSIYTWVEIWMIVGFAISATGVWLVIALALNLPNPLRSIVIWAILLGFAILVPRALTSIPEKNL